MNAVSAELRADVADLLAEVDADIAARRPVCRASGRCCHFEAYGHRLYVTAAELAYFAARVAAEAPERAKGGACAKAPGSAGGSDEHGGPRRDPPAEPGAFPERGAVAAPARVSLPQFFAQEHPAGCPYQVGGLCTARDARPLGCRIYFCDAHAQHWQNDVYEHYHRRLVALHEKHNVPYEYLEWRVGLRRLMEDAPAAGAGGPDMTIDN